MNTGEFHMFGDGINYDLAFAGNGIDLDLLGFLNEFGNHYGMFL